MSLSPRTKVLLNAFKGGNAAAYLASARKPDEMPKFGLSEVIVGGRSNVGKSTLLNAIMSRKDLVPTGKKAGRTRCLNFYRVGRGSASLVLVDAPGYGTRGHAAWGELWNRYIDSRKELRGIFILINAPHGVTDFDLQMLEGLNEMLSSRVTSSLTPGQGQTRQHVPILQPVLTKADQLQDEAAAEKCMRVIREVAPLAQSPILSAIGPSGMTFGVEAARLAICQACIS